MKTTVEFFIRLYMLCVLKHTCFYACYQAGRRCGDFLNMHYDIALWLIFLPRGLSKFHQFPSLAWTKCLITFTTVPVQPLNTSIMKSVMPHEMGHWQGIFKPCFQPRDSGHSSALPPLPQPVLAACLAASLQSPLGSSSDKRLKTKETRDIYQLILFELVWLAIGIFLLKVFNNS